MDLPHRELLAPAPMAPSVAELGEGATVAALDGRAKDAAEIASRTGLEMLWVSRLDARGAESVGRLPELRRLVVHDYKAADLAPLAGLGPRLSSLAIAGSSRLAGLTGLESLTGLSELILFDSSSYTDLAPLASLRGLETLCLEGGFSKPLRVETLAPLAGLSALRWLRLASIRVADASLAPLHGLTSLREVFVAATFPKTELAAMAAALPEARGEFLDSHRAGG